MKSNLIIILLSLALIVALYFLLQKPVLNSEKENDLYREKDSIQQVFNRLETDYSLTGKKNEQLSAELLTQKAVVKRSKESLQVMKVRERIYLKARKKELALMSEVKADSAIRYRYQYDPDSIPQKILFELLQLDYCDSVKESLSHLNESQRDYIEKQDSLSYLQRSQILLSRDQISLLLLSSTKDKELLSIKTKEINRQKRLKVLGFVVAPVVLVLALIAQ